MREDTTIPFPNPALRDELSELVREGAQLPFFAFDIKPRQSLRRSASLPINF